MYEELGYGLVCVFANKKMVTQQKIDIKNDIIVY